jgi:hypothetical protein
VSVPSRQAVSSTKSAKPATRKPVANDAKKNTGGKPHPKFGRQGGPESKAMYQARTELLIFSDQLATVKCSVQDALAQHEESRSHSVQDASRPTSSRTDRSRLRKLQLLLMKMSDELDDIALRDAQSRGQSLARSSITDWPTKQANETRRIRKKCAGTIESLLDSLETAFSQIKAAEAANADAAPEQLPRSDIGNDKDPTQKAPDAPQAQSHGRGVPINQGQRGPRPRPPTEAPPDV